MLAKLANLRRSILHMVKSAGAGVDRGFGHCHGPRSPKLLGLGPGGGIRDRRPHVLLSGSSFVTFAQEKTVLGAL